MSRFEVQTLPLDGLKLITRIAIEDSRGFLVRIFCEETLASIGWDGHISQINHTMTSHKGTVRGLHYQKPPHAEDKLVSCLRGEVWDVAVDLRADSPTYLQWHADRLSANNSRALLIPKGFAHGFQALTDNVELLYCHSVAYNPDFEAGLHPQDPALSITWPLAIRDMSPRDSQHPSVDKSFIGIKN